MQLMPCPVCGKDDKVGETVIGNAIECRRCKVEVNCRDNETTRTIWNAIAPQKERATMTTLLNRAKTIQPEAVSKISTDRRTGEKWYWIGVLHKWAVSEGTLTQLAAAIDREIAQHQQETT